MGKRNDEGRTTTRPFLIVKFSQFFCVCGLGLNTSVITQQLKYRSPQMGLSQSSNNNSPKYIAGEADLRFLHSNSKNGLSNFGIRFPTVVQSADDIDKIDYECLEPRLIKWGIVSEHEFPKDSVPRGQTIAVVVLIDEHGTWKIVNRKQISDLHSERLKKSR